MLQISPSCHQSLELRDAAVEAIARGEYHIYIQWICYCAQTDIWFSKMAQQTVFSVKLFMCLHNA